jgi:hypothetical protein
MSWVCAPGPGNSTLPERTVLRKKKITYLDFETHGIVSLAEGIQIAVDCMLHDLSTKVSTKGERNCL